MTNDVGQLEFRLAVSKRMEVIGTAIGGYAPDFELPGTDGAVHHLARYLQTFRAVGVVFLGNHCPYVQGYLDRLKQIQADYTDQGFILIGINSNDATQVPADSFDQMRQFVITHELNFPYLRDETQDVARSFGAEKTPHVFLLNQAGVLCYDGCVDDNPSQPDAIQTSYLRAAIAQVFNGAPVRPTATKPIGCSIKWRT